MYNIYLFNISVIKFVLIFLYLLFLRKFIVSFYLIYLSFKMVFISLYLPLLRKFIISIYLLYLSLKLFSFIKKMYNIKYLSYISIYLSFLKFVFIYIYLELLRKLKTYISLYISLYHLSKECPKKLRTFWRYCFLSLKLVLYPHHLKKMKAKRLQA